MCSVWSWGRGAASLSVRSKVVGSTAQVLLLARFENENEILARY